MRDEWFHSLQTHLNTLNQSMFPIPSDGFLLFTFDRVMLVFLTVLIVVRVVQAGLVLMPRPHALPNVWYWVRWWLLLHVVSDFFIKLGGLIVAVLFLVQVVIGSSGDFTVLTWYLFGQHVGAALIFYGVALMAKRLRAGAKDVPHEP